MNYYLVELAGKEYKARLTAKAACDLEDKLKTKTINV